VDKPTYYNVFFALLNRMRELSANTWTHSYAHYTFPEDSSGSSTGYQALELVKVTEDGILFSLHCHKAIEGEGTYLNLPVGLATNKDSLRYMWVERMYLQEVSSLLKTLKYPSAWNGRGWVIAESSRFQVALQHDKYKRVMINESVDAMIGLAQPEVSAWRSTIAEFELTMDKLAGWVDESGDAVPEFTITDGAIYSKWYKKIVKAGTGIPNIANVLRNPPGLKEVIVKESRPIVVSRYGVEERYGIGERYGKALFLGFGEDRKREEGESSGTAIVEWPDGRVENVPLNYIAFL
jgi:hypothetical protein